MGHKNLARHLLFILPLLIFCSSNVSCDKSPNSSMIEYRPVRASEYRNVGRPMITGESRPFQLCLKCRCCAADDPKNCSSMPCCFGIDCDLPDKPYGVCAFTPKICNCDTCAV